jgi:hypothetical protein
MGNNETSEGTIRPIRIADPCRESLQDLLAVTKVDAVTQVSADRLISFCYENRSRGIKSKFNWLTVKTCIIVCEFRQLLSDQRSEEIFMFDYESDGESRQIFFVILTGLMLGTHLRPYHVLCQDHQIIHFFVDRFG